MTLKNVGDWRHGSGGSMPVWQTLVIPKKKKKKKAETSQRDKGKK
jgi:hypothetical protein